MAVCSGFIATNPCPFKVSHNPLEESVMDGETDKHLELAEFAACRLNPGDQLDVHPPQLH